MKNSIFLLGFLLVAFSAKAQIFEPVKWKTSVTKVSESEYDLVITASIDEGWHLYSQNVPEGGPIATSFYFEEEGYTLVGTTKEGKGHEVYDKIFEMDIKYFDGKTEFKQRVKAKKGATIYAEVEFMVCDDTKCLPPTIAELEFEIQ